MEQTVAVQSPPKAIRASLSREEAVKLDNQALLERYKETGDPDLKWMLVLRYTDLVRKVASQATGIYSSFAQLDDVVQEGLVLSLYYEKELNMKEIAQVLGVSAARVSQIHSRALEHLRTEMQAYLDA